MPLAAQNMFDINTTDLQFSSLCRKLLHELMTHRLHDAAGLIIMHGVTLYIYSTIIVFYFNLNFTQY